MTIPGFKVPTTGKNHGQGRIGVRHFEGWRVKQECPLGHQKSENSEQLLAEAELGYAELRSQGKIKNSVKKGFDRGAEDDGIGALATGEGGGFCPHTPCD